MGWGNINARVEATVRRLRMCERTSRPLLKRHQSSKSLTFSVPVLRYWVSSLRSSLLGSTEFEDDSSLNYCRIS